MLGSENGREDKRNHCVSILDHFPDPDAACTYIVMPFLCYVDRPRFETVENVVEFVDQLLEGLVYMHEQGIAHRDCTVPNILMDANPLYPEGFHPVCQHLLPNGTDIAPVLPRVNRTLKFYYIDFGISTHIPAGSPERLVVGPHGRDREVPELSETVPYDPFKVDIFIIGNLLRKEFALEFSNLGFLQPLIQDMTQLIPEDRPSAAGALQKWKRIRKNILLVHRAWRLRPRDAEYWEQALGRDISALRYLGPYLAPRILSKARTLASRVSRILKRR